MILSNVKTKSLWSIFCKCAKKWKWHRATAVFVLNWRHKTAVGASTWVSQICMFFFFNLVEVSAAHISVFLSILGGTITPTWVANAFVVSTNVLLLCYARSCFLQQEILTFWPDSSKNMLLCPLILEGGPVSNVYHLLLLSLPQIILVQHFAKVPSSLDWKEIFRSHFWKYLVCIAIIVCS